MGLPTRVGSKHLPSGESFGASVRLQWGCQPESAVSGDGKALPDPSYPLQWGCQPESAVSLPGHTHEVSGGVASMGLPTRVGSKLSRTIPPPR